MIGAIDAMRWRMLRVMILSTLMAASCGRAEVPQPEPQPTTPAKDPATARSLIASGAAVIDVRTTDEFAAGHLSSAIHVPVQELPGRIGEVAKLVDGDKTRAIVVYCASGKRAAKAKAELELAGYTHVVNGGGFDDLR